MRGSSGIQRVEPARSPNWRHCRGRSPDLGLAAEGRPRCPLPPESTRSWEEASCHGTLVTITPRLEQQARPSVAAPDWLCSTFSHQCPTTYSGDEHADHVLRRVPCAGLCTYLDRSASSPREMATPGRSASPGRPLTFPCGQKRARLVLVDVDRQRGQRVRPRRRGRKPGRASSACAAWTPVPTAWLRAGSISPAMSRRPARAPATPGRSAGRWPASAAYRIGIAISTR